MTTTDNWPQIEMESKEALPRDIVRFIAECRAQPHPESHLISVLHKVQSHFGYLGVRQMDAVAQLLQVPTARVTGVATFYHFFRLRPKGRFVISVCMGTACYVKGAMEVLARFQHHLGVEVGQTSADGLFSLEVTRCLGTCGLAPVVMIEDEVHGKVKPDQVAALLDKYRDRAEVESAAGG